MLKLHFNLSSQPNLHQITQEISFKLSTQSPNYPVNRHQITNQSSNKGAATVPFADQPASDGVQVKGRPEEAVLKHVCLVVLCLPPLLCQLGEDEEAVSCGLDGGGLGATVIPERPLWLLVIGDDSPVLQAWQQVSVRTSSGSYKN